MNILPDLYVSVNSKHCHPPFSGKPRENFRNLSNPSHPGRSFCQQSDPQASLGHFILTNFIFSNPFEHFNLKLPNEYLQIWRKNIHLSMKNMQNCKSLNLTCISCFGSNALPLSNPYPLGINFDLMPKGFQGDGNGLNCLINYTRALLV